MRSRLTIATLALCAPLLGACATPAQAPEEAVPPAGQTAQMPQATAPEAAATEGGQKEAHAGPHWTYEGEDGPARWGALDASFAACASGAEQSPIDLAGAAAEDLANIAFNYQSTDVRILNNGHTVQVNYDPGSFLEVDGERYDLAQFHFHAPSEHTIDGKPSAAELHLVHKNAAGKLAVVGVMIDEGAENAAVAPVWGNLPATESAEASLGIRFNAADVLPADRTTYRYPGSLTTPPCTEGVRWHVMTQPIEMSPGQIEAFHSLFAAGNNRPVQSVNAREVVLDSSP